MDSLILRSKTVRRKIPDENKLAEQVKQLLPLLPEIDENKNLPIKMATTVQRMGRAVRQTRGSSEILSIAYNYISSRAERSTSTEIIWFQLQNMW